ncbi:MAG: Large-conductance mechanosensitive channel [Candidatus Woesearchaeota archaeon]|nr:Large-conductance mechanosensitive channel [Candidatus Woesearchaeota archaeon]
MSSMAQTNFDHHQSICNTAKLRIKWGEYMGFKDEFLEFLKEYKVIGLAIAFIIGAAATALVKSLVDNIIMPLITPLIPGGNWKTAKLVLGPVSLG